MICEKYNILNITICKKKYTLVLQKTFSTQEWPAVRYSSCSYGLMLMLKVPLFYLIESRIDVQCTIVHKH